MIFFDSDLQDSNSSDVAGPSGQSPTSSKFLHLIFNIWNSNSYLFTGNVKTVRPQIIVTPRKVAAALQAATAKVLADANKKSLSELTGDSPDVTVLPTNFSVFDLGKHDKLV